MHYGTMDKTICSSPLNLNSAWLLSGTRLTDEVRIPCPRFGFSHAALSKLPPPHGKPGLYERCDQKRAVVNNNYHMLTGVFKAAPAFRAQPHHQSEQHIGERPVTRCRGCPTFQYEPFPLFETLLHPFLELSGRTAIPHALLSGSLMQKESITSSLLVLLLRLGMWRGAGSSREGRESGIPHACNGFPTSPARQTLRDASWFFG